MTEGQRNAVKGNGPKKKIVSLGKKKLESAWMGPGGKPTKQLHAMGAELAEFALVTGAFVGMTLNKDKSSLKLTILVGNVECKEWILNYEEGSALLMQVAGEISKPSD